MTQDSESHVRAIVAITTLLKNAPELGTGQIGKEGILQIMLTMAQSDDKVQQIVAAEAIIAACAKKKDTNMIVSQVLPILKKKTLLRSWRNYFIFTHIRTGS